MSQAKTVSGVLLASWKRVRFRWAKGTWLAKRSERERLDRKGQNSYCLVGSVTRGKTYPETPQQARALELLQEAIAQQYPRIYRSPSEVSIPTWNDASGRTQEEVVAVVERARQIAKQRGL